MSNRDVRYAEDFDRCKSGEKQPHLLKRGCDVWVVPTCIAVHATIYGRDWTRWAGLVGVFEHI